MIVAGQGAQPVEDLIEEVLRPELLRDLPVDPIAHFQHALPVDRLDRRGAGTRDPPQGAARAAVERLLPVQEGQDRPGPPAPPHWGKQEVSGKRGTLVANKPAEQPRVPVHPLRDRQNDLCGLLAGPQHGDAAMGGLEELLGRAQGADERLAHFPCVFERGREPLQEQEKVQFSLAGHRPPIPYPRVRLGPTHAPIRIGGSFRTGGGRQNRGVNYSAKGASRRKAGKGTMSRKKDPAVETLDRALKRRTAQGALGALYEKLNGGKVRCYSCGHRCVIPAGFDGICRVRYNRDGVLYVPRGYVAGLQVDPIEKKPFFHAFPGAAALSFGMLGCDYHCSYCQNWLTSQALRDSEALSPPRD